MNQSRSDKSGMRSKRAMKQPLPVAIPESVVRTLRPLVYYHATCLVRASCASYNLWDDLISEGLVGLVKGVQQYDPNKGASLRTYVSIKIRKAMLEFLREHHGFRELRNAAQRGAQVTIPTTLSLQQCLRSGQENRNFQDRLVDPKCACLYAHGWEVLQAELLQKALRQLPAREQQVMEGYYARDLSMREVAEELGIPESTVNLWRKQALARLRASLLPRLGEDR